MINIKLAPLSIYNTERNFQELNELKYEIEDIEFQQVGSIYYLKIVGLKIIYKNDKYEFSEKAYVFIANELQLKLIDLNTDLIENFIVLTVSHDEIFIEYNDTEFNLDNKLLLGVYSRNNGWKKLC